MSLWIPRMGDAAHDERRKRALICAVLSYLLFLLIVMVSFMPARKTISVSVGFSGKPSVVKWSGASHRGGAAYRAGRGKRGRRVQRLTPVTVPSQKSAEKPAEKTVVHKKLSRRERLAERKQLKRAEKIKKIEQKEQTKQIGRKIDTAKPLVLEKVLEKKPAKKQKKAVVQAVVEEPEKITPKVAPKLEPIVAPVVPVVRSKIEPEPAPEPEQEVLEIGVGAEPLVGVVQDSADGDGEVSRDEYALMCAVGRTWRPPHGLKKGLSARLVVVLSAQGKVERVDIETSSRVPAYDMAARGALYRAEYPAVFWGKNIAVVFGQNGQKV